jgi:organic radical activating enzyme
MDWQKHLLKMGMIRPVSGGIQVDVMATFSHRNGKRLHRSLCDHNCTAEKGHYTCPAAFKSNQNLDPKSLAPAEKILKGLQVAIPAIKAANVAFLDNAFKHYCKKFKVPEKISTIINTTLRNNPIEINITGGNPEIHPEIIDILASLKQHEDLVINLTTTGRKFMFDNEFSKKIIKYPPDVLAFSIDSFSHAEQVNQLVKKSPKELISIWKSLPKTNGQEQKTIEALYAATILKEVYPPHTGFNLVIHPDNIAYIEDTINVLADNFPGFHIFPYPAQTGYLNKSGIFNDPGRFENLVDRIIDSHVDNSLSITPRLHYWLVLKSIFNVFKGDEAAIANIISGGGLWYCYKNKGSIRYLQIGKGSSASDNFWGGGHLGCYWNSTTVTNDDKQVWDMNLLSVVNYILGGATTLAQFSQTPCLGCGFPRLLFDVVSTEIGLNDILVQDYLRLRKNYVGY